MKIAFNKGIVNSVRGVFVEDNQVLLVGTAEGRRTDIIENVDSSPLISNLFERCMDVFHNILYLADVNTLLSLRLVSKAIYNLSTSKGAGFSPLMHTICISFDFNLPHFLESDKFKFALEYTSACIKNISIGHIKDPTLLGTIIQKANLSFGLSIGSHNYDYDFTELLVSDSLSKDQEWMLNNMKVLYIGVDITDEELTKINVILKFFADEKRAFKLTQLHFESLYDALTVPQFPNLTDLLFESVYDTLTLPELSNLLTLSIFYVKYKLTLPSLPKLTTLLLDEIHAELNFPEFPSLTQPISATIDIRHLNSEIILSESIQKSNFSFTFRIRNTEELEELNELLTNDVLSNYEEWIIDSIGGLEFNVDVIKENVEEFDALLSFFAQEERLSQLNELSFDNIHTTLILPEFSGLTKLFYTTVCCEETLKAFQLLSSDIAKKRSMNLNIAVNIEKED